jgi:hypothetical protein
MMRETIKSYAIAANWALLGLGAVFGIGNLDCISSVHEFLFWPALLIAPILGILALTRGAVKSAAITSNWVLLGLAIWYTVMELNPSRSSEEVFFAFLSVGTPMLSIASLLRGSSQAGWKGRAVWLFMGRAVAGSDPSEMEPHGVASSVNEGETPAGCTAPIPGCAAGRRRQPYQTWGAWLVVAFIVVGVIIGDGGDFWFAYLPGWIIFAVWFMRSVARAFPTDATESSAQDCPYARLSIGLSRGALFFVLGAIVPVFLMGDSPRGFRPYVAWFPVTTALLLSGAVLSALVEVLRLVRRKSGPGAGLLILGSVLLTGLAALIAVTESLIMFLEIK